MIWFYIIPEEHDRSRALVSIECHAKARQGRIVVELQAVFHAALFATPEEVVIWGQGGGIVFGAGEAMDAYESHRTR